MTDDEYIDLLRHLDDPRPSHAEEPPGFDREAAEVEFSAFAADLEAVLGVPCEVSTGAAIQDASFHGSVRLPPNRADAAELRVSNFGRLCCLHERPDLLAPESVAAIERVALRHRYLLVPTRVLRRPYGGSNPGFSGFRDWGMRYFDYI